MPETVTETTAPPATEAPVTEPPKSEDVSALPEWAQKKITDLNNESANYRVRARDARIAAEAEVKAEFETKISELATQNTTLSQELDTERVSSTKLKVALSTGLPGTQALEFADLLAGSNESEIKEHAQRLSKVTKLGNIAFDPSQGLGGGGDTPPGDLFQSFVLGQLDRS